MARTARTITVSTADIRRQWDALFDTTPSLEGLRSRGTCDSVFCCPDDPVPLDWAALSEAEGLLWLAGAPQPAILTRASIETTAPKEYEEAEAGS